MRRAILSKTTIAIIILQVVMAVMSNVANASEVRTKTIEDTCEYLAETIMSNDLGDESKEVKEMESLECNEFGDFFN